MMFTATPRHRGALLLPLLALTIAFVASSASTAFAQELRAGEFSPGFLGIYRKVMEIEPEILKYADKYDIDPLLATAVCMYESGGNADLTSGAGAHGYFQVMPSTFRLLRVPTNVEAGIKYLRQLLDQFDREDYALAAYNGGPGRVQRGRGLPLESLQYVLGVGQYRSVLHMYGPIVRQHASNLALATSRPGDTWASVSQRLGMAVVDLKLYNPFVTDARLRQGGRLVAYPDLGAPSFAEEGDDGRLRYRARIGDNYFNLAFAFGVDLDSLRTVNGLWRLQVLPPGMVLTIPEKHASPIPSSPRAPMPPVERAVSRTTAARAAASVRTHRVARGENLTTIAQRYGTTVRALQTMNGLKGRSVIRVGQRIRIPAADN